MVRRYRRLLRAVIGCAVVAVPSCQVLSGLAGFEVPARQIGEACEVDPECAKGHCADGICCTTACDEECVACNIEDSVGTCQNHIPLSDPDGDCGHLGHCDGQGTCVAGTHLWSLAFGDEPIQQVLDLALDSADDILLVGAFSGLLNFGGDVLESEGDDVFVAKLGGAAGDHRWSRAFGDGDKQSATAVATDRSDNAFVAGNFTGYIDFGTGENHDGGARDSVFLVSFDRQGATRWDLAFSATFEGREPDRRLGPPSVAVDGAGNVLLYGHFRGRIDLGAGPLDSLGEEDVYVAKLDNNGQLLWQRSFGLAPADPLAVRPWALQIEVDSADDLIIIGTHRFGIDFGAGIHLPDAENLEQSFVAKLAGADGAPQWSHGWDGPGPQMANSLAVDRADDSVVVAGAFANQLGVAGASLPTSTPASVDVFVSRFAADGAHVRTRRFPAGPGIIGANWNTPHEMVIDPNGTVALYGMLANTVSFGPSPVESAGHLDVFIAKLTPGLDHLLSKRYGDGASQIANRGAIDQQGNMVVTGNFQGKLDFGSTVALDNPGQLDIFLVKFSP